MHVATIHQPVRNWAQDMDPGRYWLEDHNAAELLWHSRGFGGVVLEHAEPPVFLGNNPNLEGAGILVVRVGGFGDLLWLNAVYEALRKKHEGIRIVHCCFERYAPVLEGFVDEVLPYPLAGADAANFDHIVWLENAIEGRPCTDGEHPADRLARLFGVELERRTAYRVTDDEHAWARETWPRTEKRRICVQPGTSTDCKDYPRIRELMALLHRKGFELLVVGPPRSVREKEPEGVLDATQCGLTIRQSIALAGECDCILAPDSVFVHVGDALGVPVVGLYGPFDGATYMKGYNGVSVQGPLPCSPCHWHPRGSAFPPGKPCFTRGFCTALGEISPDFAAIMVERALKGGA